MPKRQKIAIVTQFPFSAKIHKHLDLFYSENHPRVQVKIDQNGLRTICFNSNNGHRLDSG